MTIEKTVVETAFVACDGDPKVGHPRVFLDVAKKGSATCPYCSRTFILANLKPKKTK